MKLRNRNYAIFQRSNFNRYIDLFNDLTRGINKTKNNLQNNKLCVSSFIGDHVIQKKLTSINIGIE